MDTAGVFAAVIGAEMRVRSIHPVVTSAARCALAGVFPTAPPAPEAHERRRRRVDPNGLRLPRPS
jgi:hypothetical protein